jgi:hypothetical protein
MGRPGVPEQSITVLPAGIPELKSRPYGGE